MRSRLALVVCALVLLTGCAPSVSPLYRDYEVESMPLASADDAVETAAESDEGAVLDRLRAALADAGWAEAPASTPNTVSTEDRPFGSWGLYRVLVSVDAIPIGEQHVRVQFHPVRRYITGGRSKIPYLGRSLRSSILPELNEALEAHGFYPVGTPRERDEKQVEGT